MSDYKYHCDHTTNDDDYENAPISVFGDDDLLIGVSADEFLQNIEQYHPPDRYTTIYDAVESLNITVANPYDNSLICKECYEHLNKYNQTHYVRSKSAFIDKCISATDGVTSQQLYFFANGLPNHLDNTYTEHITTLTSLEPIETIHDYCISPIIIYASTIYNNAQTQ